ncbi:glycoside hydrolase family 32 protein [Microbacterium marinum]|uniref:glycoside hydrolase family 32 protein n=1 Tax=Microbacterium marinum TaxID=421115 RepID=UPI003850C8F1
MRPTFHFTAESGWINDPHGITYRNGGYDVFYQYVPGQTVWGPNCHWGHATGPDLLSLTEGPVALAPGDGDGGIWTGSLVADEADRTVIFYTATSEPDIGIGRIRQATPEGESWSSWTKGPIVATVPENLDIIAYRDPFIRREEDGWRMFVGAGFRDGTAAALAYTSDDLDRWTYEGVALQRSTMETDDVWMGALWECPQIVDVDGHAVMVSSVWDADVLHYAGYALGSYADGRFTADAWGRLTYGDSYYAPSFFEDAEGRPCLLFWMRGIGGGEEDWASAHSVPHLLSVEDGQLVATPHPDVAAHRIVGTGADVEGLAADIVWDSASGELVVTSNGRSVASIRRENDSLRISVDGVDTDVPARGPVRVLFDGPILEVSSRGAIYGARVKPTGTRLEAAADRGSLTIHSIN